MIGHRQVIDARLQGKKPTAIFFEIDRCRDRLFHPEDLMAVGLYPVVYLDDGEHPDLRFAVGCNCIATAPQWSPPLLALAYALADAGASTVVVSAPADSGDLMVYANNEWSAE